MKRNKLKWVKLAAGGMVCLFILAAILMNVSFSQFSWKSSRAQYIDTYLLEEAVNLINSEGSYAAADSLMEDQVGNLGNLIIVDADGKLVYSYSGLYLNKDGAISLIVSPYRSIRTAHYDYFGAYGHSVSGWYEYALGYLVVGNGYQPVLVSGDRLIGYGSDSVRFANKFKKLGDDYDELLYASAALKVSPSANLDSYYWEYDFVREYYDWDEYGNYVWDNDYTDEELAPAIEYIKAEEKDIKSAGNIYANLIELRDGDTTAILVLDKVRVANRLMDDIASRHSTYDIILNLVLIISIIGAILLIAYWVFKDAQTRGMSGGLWGILALIGNVVTLLIYLIVRPDRRACPRCGYMLKKAYVACPACALPLKASCPHCGKVLEPEWIACPACGERLKGGGELSAHNHSAPEAPAIVDGAGETQEKPDLPENE